MAWKTHPVTQWVMSAASTAADQQREHWMLTSWDGGEASLSLLQELRVRADAYRAIEETTYERWCELAGVDPVVE